MKPYVLATRTLLLYAGKTKQDARSATLASAVCCLQDKEICGIYSRAATPVPELFLHLLFHDVGGWSTDRDVGVLTCWWLEERFACNG